MYAKGKVAKDPDVCAATAPIISRELRGRPQDQGGRVRVRLCPVRPNGDNPEQVKALVAKHPKVVLDQKGCEFSRTSCRSQGPDAGDQVERPGRPQRPVHGLQQHRASTRCWPPTASSTVETSSPRSVRSASSAIFILDEGVFHGLRPSVLRGRPRTTGRSRSRACPQASRTWWSGKSWLAT